MRLGFSATAARSAYRARMGDVGAEVPWHAARLDRYTAAQLELAAQVWSNRASGAYRAAAGFSDLSIRLAHVAPLDLVGLAARFASESLAHVELCVRVATVFGGTADIDPPLIHEPGDDLPALVVVRCCVEASIAAAEAIAAARGAAPLAEAALHVLATDLQWHAQLGALYAEHAGPSMTDTERGQLVLVARQAVRALPRPAVSSGDPRLAELGIAPADTFPTAAAQVIADVASYFLGGAGHVP